MRSARPAARIRLLNLSGTQTLETQVEFRWQAPQPGLKYQFELIDDTGHTLYEAQLETTTLRPPASVQLIAGALYGASARLPDGRKYRTPAISVSRPQRALQGSAASRCVRAVVDASAYAVRLGSNGTERRSAHRRTVRRTSGGWMAESAGGGVSRRVNPRSGPADSRHRFGLEHLRWPSLWQGSPRFLPSGSCALRAAGRGLRGRWLRAVRWSETRAVPGELPAARGRRMICGSRFTHPGCAWLPHREFGCGGRGARARSPNRLHLGPEAR
jgi:hypothetical protein